MVLPAQSTSSVDVFRALASRGTARGRPLLAPVQVRMITGRPLKRLERVALLPVAFRVSQSKWCGVRAESQAPGRVEASFWTIRLTSEYFLRAIVSSR
jgi:hypothetical protein